MNNKITKILDETTSAAAANLGRLGGSKTSTAKTESSRRNGQLGGRPRNISYYVRSQTEYETIDTPIAASTDAGARRAAKKYLAAHPAPAGALVALMFHRRSDGCAAEIAM